MLEKRELLTFYFTLFAVTAWPFLNFLGSPANIAEAAFSHLGLIFIIFFVIGAFFCEVTSRFLKVPKINMLIIYTFIFFSLFYYYLYAAFCERVGGILSNFLPVNSSSVIFIFSGIVLFSYLSRIKVVQSAFLSFVMILFVFSFSQFSYFYISYEKQSNIKYEKIKNKNYDESYNYFQEISFNERPNIYYLLIDAFPRHDTLLPIRDNTAFINFFKDKKFLVATEAYSNYETTRPSLSATFQMSYLTPGDAVAHDVLSPRQAVFKVLKNNGYKIAILPTNHVPFSGINIADVQIYKHNPLIVAFISNTVSAFFENSILNTYLIRYLRSSAYFTENEINRIPALVNENESWFTFVHYLHFHDYAFDNYACEISTSYVFVKGMTKGIEVNSKCLEALVEKSVNIILSKDPEAIILVQSDHSAWNQQDEYTTKEGFDKAFGIFSAVRFPEHLVTPEIKAYFENSPSPVNNFRIIFALLSGKTPDLLPYHAFIDEGYEEDLANLRYAPPVVYKQR